MKKDTKMLENSLIHVSQHQNISLFVAIILPDPLNWLLPRVVGLVFPLLTGGENICKITQLYVSQSHQEPSVSHSFHREAQSSQIHSDTQKDTHTGCYLLTLFGKPSYMLFWIDSKTIKFRQKTFNHHYYFTTNWVSLMLVNTHMDSHPMRFPHTVRTISAFHIGLQESRIKAVTALPPSST